MEEIIERLIEWSKGNPQGPLSIHLDPTNRCNLRCKFCWQRSHERLGWLDTENELSRQKLLSIVREAAGLGVREWLISGGGEPFLRLRTTTRIMIEIKKLGMFGDIITNGTIATEETLSRIVECGWDVFRVSINSPYEDEHDFMVDKKGAFKSAIKNIKKLVQLKDELGRSKPEIGFNTVINSMNYPRLPDLVKFLHELGGSLINIQTIILYSEEEKKWSLNETQRKESRKYIKKALRIAEKYGIKNNLQAYLEEKVMEGSTEMDGMIDLVTSDLKKMKPENSFANTFCFEPFYLVTVRANGTVGSCRLFGDEGINIHGKTLRQVWFSDYFDNARRILLRGKPQSFCSKCGANEFLQNRMIRLELMKRLSRWKER